MNLNERIKLNECRALAYKHLSTYFYLPYQDALDQLIELEAVLERICPDAATDIVAMGLDTNLDALKVDYSQLFVGPFRLAAAPYGSVYLEEQRTVMGASTVDAERQYQEAGLDLSQSLNDAPDHVAVELEFLYYLIYKEIETLGTSDEDAAAIWLQRQQTFLNRHLGRWIAAFAEAIEQGARTEFYTHLARATRLFVLADQTALADVITSNPAGNGVLSSERQASSR